MTCNLCYDHAVFQATGHNGELVPIRCPVCRSEDIELVRVRMTQTHGARCLSQYPARESIARYSARVYAFFATKRYTATTPYSA